MGSTAPGNDDIELTHDPLARQRGILSDVTEAPETRLQNKHLWWLISRAPLLKHIYDLSNEAARGSWVYDP